MCVAANYTNRDAPKTRYGLTTGRNIPELAKKKLIKVIITYK